MVKRASPESFLCKRFVNHVSILQRMKLFDCPFLMFHVANQQVNGPRYGKHLKELGLIAGIADYILLFPGGHFAAIEFKAGKASKVTNEQRQFEILCQNYQAPYLLTWDIDSAVEFIKKCCLQFKPAL